MLVAQVVFRNTVALSWTDQRRKYVTDGRRTSSFLSTLFSSSPLLLFWACHGEGAGGGGGVLCNSLRGSWRRPEANPSSTVPARVQPAALAPSGPQVHAPSTLRQDVRGVVMVHRPPTTMAVGLQNPPCWRGGQWGFHWWQQGAKRGVGTLRWGWW